MYTYNSYVVDSYASMHYLNVSICIVLLYSIHVCIIASRRAAWKPSENLVLNRQGKQGAAKVSQYSNGI